MIGRALVTGAGGFIGRAVSSALIRQGIHVAAITPSTPGVDGVSQTHCFRLPDRRLDDILTDWGPQLVVHCAGSASVGASFTDPAGDFASSVAVTEHLLASVARHSRSSRVIILSSAAVLGQPEILPSSERAQPAPISPYGFHRWMCEILGTEYAALGIPLVNARLFSVYGPGLKRQLLWDIYRKWRSSEQIQLDGTGQETRDFIYIDDLAAALLLIAERADFNGECIHVASGEATTVSTFARVAVDALGMPKPIVFTGRHRTGDPLHWQADTTRLRSLGMTCSTPLHAGLARWAEWALLQ